MRFFKEFIRTVVAALRPLSFRSWPLADVWSVRFPAFRFAARHNSSIWTRDVLTLAGIRASLSESAVNHPSALAPLLVTATSECHAYTVEVTSTTPGLRREYDQFRPESGIVHNSRELDW